MSDVSLAALARYYRAQAAPHLALAEREEAQLPLMVRGRRRAERCIAASRQIAKAWTEMADEIDAYIEQKSQPHEQGSLL